jgi:hypothetical protein
MALLVCCQIILLVYHQVTTLVDFFPFNGSRYYNWKEKLAEGGANALLMSLPPFGFAFQIRSLMVFGVVYYFVLFAIELIIWWIPYLTTPTGRWRRIYNLMLSLSTSNFEKGDALERWTDVYHRLHRGTITILPRRGDRVVPNLEHMILHAWTLLTAILTASVFLSLGCT